MTPLANDESLFQLLVESVRDYAIFVLDADGHIASWNRGAQQIKGYAADEVIGKHFSLFFNDEDRAEDKPSRLLARAAAEGRVEDEGWRVRRDGTRFWASVVITALEGPSGVFAFAKVTRDLTARRLAEQELRTRERQLRDTQALAGLGSWEWNVAADSVQWTDELFEIYGLEPQSFEATFGGYLERVHPEDRQHVRERIENAFRTGSVFEFEERIVRPDGAVRVLRSRGRAVRDDSGATTHLMGACLDITELRAAEQQAVELVREQTAREAAEAAAAGLRFLLEASEALASSLDYPLTLRRVAELAVPRVADWCAVDLVQPDGTLRRVAVAGPEPGRAELASSCVSPTDRPSGAWKVIESGEPAYHPNVEQLVQDGSGDGDLVEEFRRHGLRSVVTVPLTGRAATVGTLTLGQAESGRRLSEYDVSLARELARHAALAIENARLHAEVEQQNLQLAEQAAQLELQAEALRQRSIDAEAANRAKADFLATMSHELRTPLNAIFGYADLLQLGLHGPVTTAQQDALERIKRNQRALLVLINDVLNFAKLEAGKLEIEITDVPVSEVISDLEKLIWPQLEGKGLSFTCEPCASAIRARGDRERIEQILLNLLTNAIKFTPSGGQISITADSDADSVRISVRDTGCGIPADRLTEVFEPFVQIDRQTREPGHHGVGLGLAISRNLAESMNGSLAAESHLDAGSTFTLTLQTSRS